MEVKRELIVSSGAGPGERSPSKDGAGRAGGRSLDLTNPGPDRKFAAIKPMWRDSDVAPDGAQ
jgi:hypothetical protein